MARRDVKADESAERRTQQADGGRLAVVAGDQRAHGALDVVGVGVAVAADERADVVLDMGVLVEARGSVVDADEQVAGTIGFD
jgi:hypothetical protein